MLRVGIADDHQLFVDGLKNALNAVPDISVVMTASDATELLRSLETVDLDVLLLDLDMPGGGGNRVLEAMARPIPVIVVTMHSEPEISAKAYDLGARVVLPKSIELKRLAATIRAVASGEDLRGSPSEVSEVLASFEEPRLDPGAESLTDREREILSLLAAGVSRTEEIAERLFISPKTVKNHLASIFDKLAVSDRTQAAVEAIRLGIGSS